ARAIEVTRNNYVAQYNLGDYLMDVPGRGADALAQFQEALRIQPDSADAYNAIGGYYMRIGREADAVAQFNAALHAQPGNAEAHFNLGLLSERDPARATEALAHYQAAVNSKPQWQRGQKTLGILLVRMGNRKEALLHLLAAQRIQYDPDVAKILASLD